MVLSSANNEINKKLDGVGPVDKRPSIDKLHHFARKKKKKKEKKKKEKKNVTCDT